MSRTEDETISGVTFDAATPAEAGTQEPPERDARALRKELFSDELIDELLARVDRDGLALTGRGGLLPEMLKAVLERGLDAELTDHLGYERGDPAGPGVGIPVTGPAARRWAPRSATSAGGAAGPRHQFAHG